MNKYAYLKHLESAGMMTSANRDSFDLVQNFYGFREDQIENDMFPRKFSGGSHVGSSLPMDKEAASLLDRIPGTGRNKMRKALQREGVQHNDMLGRASTAMGKANRRMGEAWTNRGQSRLGGAWNSAKDALTPASRKMDRAVAAAEAEGVKKSPVGQQNLDRQKKRWAENDKRLGGGIHTTQGGAEIDNTPNKVKRGLGETWKKHKAPIAAAAGIGLGAAGAMYMARRNAEQDQEKVASATELMMWRNR